MLEAGDLNDSQILAATRQAKDGRGATQFSIVLPSGRKVTSEWVSEDNLRNALQVWLGTIKTEAVEDAKADRIAKGRAAMLAQTGKDLSSASSTQSTSAADVTYTAQRAAAAGSDPLEYARHQLTGYARKVEELKGQIAVLSTELEAAMRLQGRWFTVVSSLTESENV